MASSSNKPTPALQHRISAFIRAGGYPQVAAQAEGIANEVFNDWLRCGQGRRSPQVFRDFAQAVFQAIAQARLKAETAVFADNALYWLKFGPGKQTTTDPGWTNPAKAPTAGKPEEANPLLQAELIALWRRLQDALAPFPEARIVAAAAMDGDAVSK
jgi:hypothetical protein